MSRAVRARSSKVAHLSAGRPPRGEADARRQEREGELLRSAAVVLAKRGIRSTPMDALAEELGIPKTVLYRYFDSRDALLAAILGGFAAQWRALQAQPWRGLGRNLSEVLALTRAHRSEFMLLARHCATDPEYRDYFEELHSNIVERTDRLLETSSPAMAADPLMRQLSSRATAGFLLDAVLWWIEQGDPARDDDFILWARKSLDAFYTGWRAHTSMRPPQLRVDE